LLGFYNGDGVLSVKNKLWPKKELMIQKRQMRQLQNEAKDKFTVQAKQWKHDRP